MWHWGLEVLAVFLFSVVAYFVGWQVGWDRGYRDSWLDEIEFSGRPRLAKPKGARLGAESAAAQGPLAIQAGWQARSETNLG